MELIESGGMCRILLLYLQNNDGIQRVKYRSELNLGGRAANRNHNLLYEKGLIEIVPNRNKLLFRLTEKGRLIAEKIQEIQDLLD